MTLTDFAPHLVTHSRVTVSKLVNFVMESAAVLQTGTINSLLKKSEQGAKILKLLKENRFFKDGECG